MKYAIFLKLPDGQVDRSLDFPGEYDSEYLANGVAHIYGKAVGRSYIVREVPERELGAPAPTVDVDLPTQYHKALGELIAAKEERNTLRASVKDLTYKLEYAKGAAHDTLHAIQKVQSNASVCIQRAFLFKMNWLC